MTLPIERREAADTRRAETRWSLTITCPWPRNRARDDFFVRPGKATQAAVEWFGPGTEVTLTARTVRLRHTAAVPPGDLTRWYERLAVLLDCLYLGTRGEDGQCRLPRPVRTEIREDGVPPKSTG
ncbi:hypothetical protein [Streptomyces triculaminicus]|uniref:hypothetical protein n=1 Tax=Streptomyces triculaminicus TaxID=2816232 RepID=UPI003795A858